ncbi:MAG: hypothetical protein ACI4EE_10485 [Lachnospiraceae bacterium]
MKKIKSYTDGDYTVNKYDNGTVERYLTGSDKPIEQETKLTETEALALDTNIKMDYLLGIAELREISGGGIACKVLALSVRRKAVAA